MAKKEIFKKFLLILALTLSISIGFLALSKFTAREAQAYCYEYSCISDGFATAVDDITTAITDAISAAADDIVSYLGTRTDFIVDKVDTKINGKTGDITYKTGVRNHVVNAISDLWFKELEPAMANMTKQLFAYNADQARTLNGFMDAANFMRLVMAYEDQRLQSHREQRVGDNTVVMGTIAGGMARANAFRKTYNAVAPTENTARSANAKTGPSGAGSVADLKSRWDIYTSRYCRQADNNKASGCSADQSFAGQDLDVTGTIFSHETLNIKDEPELKTTINDLIANIAEPEVNDPVLASAVNSASGQRAVLEREAYKAKRQVIYDALYHVVSRRVPGSQIGTYTSKIREAAGINTSQIANNPSYNEVMHVLINERPRSGMYALEQISEPEVNKRELVIQQAVQLMQLNDQIDLLDRLSLILAAQVGAEVIKAKQPSSAVEGGALQ